MRKILSLLLLAIPLLLAEPVKAQVWREIGSNAAFISAISNASTTPIYLKLTTTLNYNSVIEISNGKDVTVDLNKCSIQPDGCCAFQIIGGKLTLTGEGTITGVGGLNGVIWLQGSTNKADANYSVLTINKDVNLTSTDGYAIRILHNGSSSFGVVVDVYGTIVGHAALYTNGNIQQTEGNVPVVNIYSGASLSSANDKSVIYAAGYAKWNITGTSISGGIGIYAKAGLFNIVNSTISSVGSYVAPSANNDGYTCNGNAIVCDSHGAYAGGIVMVISGDQAKITSANGYAVEEVVTSGDASTMQITLDGGTYTGSLGSIKVHDTTNPVIVVMNGKYSTDVTDFLGEDVIIDKKDPFWKATYAPVYDTRNISNGEWGTVCYDRQIARVEGANVYEFVSNEITSLGVAEVDSFVAGKAYLINTIGTQQKIRCIPTATATEPIANNGLVGTFSNLATTAPAWIIKGDLVKKVAAGSSVPQYRAYIPNLDNVKTLSQAAPVARRFTIIRGTATQLVEIENEANVVKYTENGRVVIVREGQKFNTTGQQIK